MRDSWPEYWRDNILENFSILSKNIASHEAYADTFYWTSLRKDGSLENQEENFGASGWCFLFAHNRWMFGEYIDTDSIGERHLDGGKSQEGARSRTRRAMNRKQKW